MLLELLPNPGEALLSSIVGKLSLCPKVSSDKISPGAGSHIVSLM